MAGAALNPDLPWSNPVRLDEIGRGLTRRLVADEAVRKRIAEELELVELPALEAYVEVAPAFEGGKVDGRLIARVVQTCGVTLEPFETPIEASFQVRFTTRPPEPVDTDDAELGLPDLDAPDYVESGVIDLAGLVVEHLSLELDPHPRKPDAVFEPPQEEREPSPFSVLAQLKPRDSGA
ncbi:MAG TPA: DUF177 domain-containing protein [Caulobacteraceae bacterium]|nr:DUF177 domain-containing protein [Caulobacteraceae bacterium]